MAARARSFALCLAAALLATVGCQREPAPLATLTLSGSTSVQPFAEKWAEHFADVHPEIRVDVQGGGSTAGLRAVSAGAADVGMVSRELSAGEDRGVRAHLVARDGIVIVVHPSNPLRSLSLSAVRGLFGGAIADWSALGGPRRPVTLLTREEGSGTRDAFEHLALGGAHIAAAALVQDSGGALREMVGSDPGAIGYLSLGHLSPQVRAVPLVLAPDAAPVVPTLEEIHAGRYPLVRPFFFVVRAAGAPVGVATDPLRLFLGFILSPVGQRLAQDEGLVAVR